MSDDISGDNLKPNRRIIIEVNPNNRQQKPEQRQLEQHNNQPQYSLEMQPVLRAALEYGRRTYSIGALHGAVAIDKLVERIKNLAPVVPELNDIIDDANTMSKKLRSKLDGYDP